MLVKKIVSDLLLCKECKNPIPKGQSKCSNPNCPTNKPIQDETKLKISFKKQIQLQD